MHVFLECIIGNGPRFHGRGILQAASGDKLSGTWCRGKISGKGTINFANGDARFRVTKRPGVHQRGLPPRCTRVSLSGESFTELDLFCIRQGAPTGEHISMERCMVLVLELLPMDLRMRGRSSMAPCMARV